MFGLGLPEILLILVVALVFVGPKKLPEIGASIGKAMGEFRKSLNQGQQPEAAPVETDKEGKDTP
ncbi:twin-arginine translocase TatA/TatE family subunit [Eubacteriales bacterium OttesenSCG-928-A19]|nr:twin-arginine translocase TatA/TatE family subunit [Eubacteriales bacterium OttesenSCG-928-A19]